MHHARKITAQDEMSIGIVIGYDGLVKQHLLVTVHSQEHGQGVVGTGSPLDIVHGQECPFIGRNSFLARDALSAQINRHMAIGIDIHTQFVPLGTMLNQGATAFALNPDCRSKTGIVYGQIGISLDGSAVELQ